MPETLIKRRITVNATGFYQGCSPKDCPIHRFVEEFNLQPKLFISARTAAARYCFIVEDHSKESFSARCPKTLCQQDMLVELEPGRDGVMYVLKE